jgi:hypothetical protein
MPMTPTVDVLLDARALLARPGGWVQGTEVAPREQGGQAYCIQGAMGAATGSMSAWWEARRRVEETLGEHIPDFNDRDSTTQGDVLDVIDRAISAEWRGDPIRRSRSIALTGLPPEMLLTILKHTLENEAFDISEPPSPPAA